MIMLKRRILMESVRGRVKFDLVGEMCEKLCSGVFRNSSEILSSSLR